MDHKNELILNPMMIDEEELYNEISGFNEEEYIKELLSGPQVNIPVNPIDYVLYRADKTIDETEKLLVRHETLPILREIMKTNTLDKKEILEKYGVSFFTAATEYKAEDYDIRKNRLEEFKNYFKRKRILDLVNTEIEFNNDLSRKQNRILKKLKKDLQHNINIYEDGLSGDNELDGITSKLKENCEQFSCGFFECADTSLVPEEDNIYDGHQTLTQKRLLIKNQVAESYLTNWFSVNKDKIKDIAKKASVILLTIATFGALSGLSATVQAYTQDTYEDADSRNDMYNYYKNMLTGEGVGEKELQEIQDLVTSHINIPTDNLQAFNELSQAFYESYKVADKTVTRYSTLYPLIQYQDNSNDLNLVPLIKDLEELDQITGEALLCKSNDNVCFQEHLASEKTKLSELKTNLGLLNNIKSDIEKSDLPQYHYKLLLKAGDKIEIKNHVPDFSKIRVDAKNNGFSIFSDYDIEVRYIGDEVNDVKKINGGVKVDSGDIKISEYFDEPTDRVIKESDDTIKFIDIERIDDILRFGGFKYVNLLGIKGTYLTPDTEGNVFLAGWPKGSEDLKGDFLISVKCNKRGWSFSDDGLTNIDIDFGAGANEEIKNYLTGLQQDMDSFIDRSNTEIDNVPVITTATKQIYQQAPEPTAEPTSAPLQKEVIESVETTIVSEEPTPQSVSPEKDNIIIDGDPSDWEALGIEHQSNGRLRPWEDDLKKVYIARDKIGNLYFLEKYKNGINAEEKTLYISFFDEDRNYCASFGRGWHGGSLFDRYPPTTLSKNEIGLKNTAKISGQIAEWNVEDSYDEIKNCAVELNVYSNLLTAYLDENFDPTKIPCIDC